MKLIRRFLARLANLVRMRTNDQRLREEIEEHIAMQTSENLRAGMAATESRRQAVLKFGSAEAVREQHHAEQTIPFMENLLRDLSYALRQMRLNPGFALTVATTLALSVGLATAVFCVIDAVVLRPLPYDHPERIVELNSIGRLNVCCQPASWPSYQFERDHAKTFAVLAAYSTDKLTVETPEAGPVLLDATSSTANFFDVFRVSPLLGRTYRPDEDQEGKSNVVVLGYDAWKTYFGGDRGAVGRNVKLNGAPFTVIGVMPPEFRYPLSGQELIYIPRLSNRMPMPGWNTLWLERVGRLQAGVTPAQARAEMTTIYSAMGRENRECCEKLRPSIPLLSESSVDKGHRGFWLWPLAASLPSGASTSPDCCSRADCGASAKWPCVQPSAPAAGG